MTVTQELGDMNDCEWMITRFKVRAVMHCRSLRILGIFPLTNVL